MSGKSFMVRNVIFFFIVYLFAGLVQPAFSQDINVDSQKMYEGKIVDSIIIENRNIYDTRLKEYNKFIFKYANKLHIKTQKKVIAREVLLKKGEPYSELLAEETSRILRQRFILYDAWTEKEIYNGNKLLVRIVTVDRWSLSTGVDIQHEGSETKLKMGASEKNLFGQNRLLSFYYISQSDDDNYTDLSFVDKRLFGKKYMGAVELSSNPLKKTTILSFGRPYYELNQQFGFFTTTIFKKGRVDYYVDESLFAQSFYHGNKTESEIFYRIGSYQTKYLMRLNYTYNYEKNNSAIVSFEQAQDSLYHGVTIGLEYSNFVYKKKYNINGFNYTEDFNGGVVARLDYQRAYTPSKTTFIYDLVSLLARKNFIGENYLLTCRYLYKSWSNSPEKIRTTTGINLKYYNQTIKDITFACNADFTSDISNQSFDLISLGGTTGIRGADKYFLTGDKRLIFNSEIRFRPRTVVNSLNVGGVIFSDFGNIVHDGQDFKLSNIYTTFGGGLRIAFDKSSKSIIRIDFAYSSFNGWQLSFGSGQYFNVSDKN